tara:strand:- start:686 stop:1333 length:648 start_codon:yes stop_codon:yes gene_type:complete
MDLTIYPLSSFAVLGRRQFQAQKRNYNRELSIRRTGWTSASNVWNMKNDQYDINTKENLRAYTGMVGSIQRNFGLEVSEFMENKRKIFIERTGKTPVNGGDRANSFGRSMELASLYNEGAQAANLRRADIKQGEDLRGAQRTLQSKQSQEIGKRGFEPIPDEPPVKPVGPSYLDQAIGLASTAASFISPIQSIGKAAGLGLGAEAGTMRHLWFGA